MPQGAFHSLSVCSVVLGGLGLWEKRGSLFRVGQNLMSAPYMSKTRAHTHTHTHTHTRTHTHTHTRTHTHNHTHTHKHTHTHTYACTVYDRMMVVFLLELLFVHCILYTVYTYNVWFWPSSSYAACLPLTVLFRLGSTKCWKGLLAICKFPSNIWLHSPPRTWVLL